MSKINFEPNGHFNINGIDIHPGSDADADLITIDVSGTPVFKWVESESKFSVNTGLNIIGSSDIVQQVIRAHFTQTANILEIQKSDTTVLIDVNGTGGLSFSDTARIDWAKITANSVTLSVGSTPSSLVGDLRIAHDGNLYHIDEAGGVSPAITLIVDFISVTAFNWVRIIAEYDGGASHSVCIELWNWNSSAWDVFDSQNGVESSLTNHDFFVPSDTNYIGTDGNAGEVRVRFNHLATGNGAHDLDIDVVALYQ